MSVNDKLVRTRFVVDSGNPHITVDTSVCSECLEGACLIVCPGQCFEKEQQKLTFSWENCLECGSCRVVCPKEAISWNYPRGGFGICFRYG